LLKKRIERLLRLSESEDGLKPSQPKTFATLTLSLGTITAVAFALIVFETLPAVHDVTESLFAALLVDHRAHACAPYDHLLKNQN